MGLRVLFNLTIWGFMYAQSSSYAIESYLVSGLYRRTKKKWSFWEMNSFKLETSDKHLTRHFPLESKQNMQNTHQIMQIMRLTLVGGIGFCDIEKISNVDIEKELQVISIFSIFSRPVFSNIFPFNIFPPQCFAYFRATFI